MNQFSYLSYTDIYNINGIEDQHQDPLLFIECFFGPCHNWSYVKKKYKLNVTNFPFFVIVVINILMIVFYNEFIKQYKIALNKKAMVEQYNSIKNQVSTMAETNEKMRRIRHDMRNHMIVMEQMLDDKNYDRLKLYMQKLADIAHENEQKIDTGNIELDAILNNKINEAQDSNIKTETDITCLCSGHLEQQWQYSFRLTYTQHLYSSK